MGLTLTISKLMLSIASETCRVCHYDTTGYGKGGLSRTTVPLTPCSDPNDLQPKGCLGQEDRTESGLAAREEIGRSIAERHGTGPIALLAAKSPASCTRSLHLELYGVRSLE